MSYKKPEFASNEIYHIYNRGVEKRNIFENDSDYYRFIFALYECNDSKPVRIRERREARNKSKISGQGVTLPTYQGREAVVEVLAFCLMPNHYHLIVRQSVDKGITYFMKKIGDSYVGYFNEKYQRKGLGSLFQGAFKAVHVSENDQLLNLVSYVFANPVGILEYDWKEGIEQPQQAIDFLNTYRWSSYLDSVGVKNFPSVTSREMLFNIFGEGGLRDVTAEETDNEKERASDNIKKSVEDWILYKASLNKGINQVSDLLLE